MSRHLIAIGAATALLLGAATPCPVAQALEKSALEAFPAPAAGIQRFVIDLPDKQRDEEHAFKVELFAGKTMLTDGVNLYRLASTIETRTLQGWGYSYYEVIGYGEAINTLMAAPEGAATVETFVTGTPLLVRYNSRLPLVIYAPPGYEVRYRIWRADETLRPAEKR